MIKNKFYRKEKLLENEKDLAKQKLSSKPAKAAETTETLTQNRQNIPRSSQQNDKSKIAKPPFYLHWDFRIFWYFPLWNIQLDFFPSLNWEKIQLDISNCRMSKNPKIPVQIERRFGYFVFVILLGRSWNILTILG